MSQCTSAEPKEEMGDPVAVPVKCPFNFALYSTFRLKDHELPRPYLYLKDSWKCIIRTQSGRGIPTRVVPRSDVNGMHLAVDLFGDYSTFEENEVKRTITAVFCSELDLSPFYRIAISDPNLWKVVRQVNGLKPVLSQSPFEALIKAVIRQLIRADAARRTVAMLVMRFGEKRTIRGEDYYGFPSPQNLSKASKSQLMSCRAGYKWKLIKKISSDVASGNLDFNELAGSRSEEVGSRLMEYKGIGYWTSGIFIYDGLRRLNAYPIRDISLRRAVSLLYFRTKPISWRKVESFFDHYKQFIGIATTYLFAAIWLRQQERMVISGHHSRRAHSRISCQMD